MDFGPSSEGKGKGASTVYLFGVGFDEKLVIRAVLKVGVKPGETVILAYGSTAAGELERAKVENAVKNLRGILEGTGVRVIEIPMSAMSFPEDVSSIVTHLREVQPKRVVVSLGSGMRYLAFTLMLSCLLYKELFRRDAKIVVHVAREDGLYDVTVNLDMVKVSIRRRELDMLCLLYGEALKKDEAVKKGAKALGIKPSTLYKLLNHAERMELIVTENGVVRVTELGKALALVKCSDEFFRGGGHG